ncbi:MAG: bifunctional diguanylate cyclase/phosphodiesterase [Pseudomonadota bacterium]
MAKRVQPIRGERDEPSRWLGGSDAGNNAPACYAAGGASASDAPERLPPFEFRAARLAKLLAEAADTPVALVDLGDGNGPALYTAVGADPRFAEAVSEEWRHPVNPGHQTLYRGIGAERAAFAVASCAPVTISGRRGWAAAVAPVSAGAGATEVAGSAAALIAELTAELASQAKAHALWSEHLQRDTSRVSHFLQLAELGTLFHRYGDDGLDASPLAHTILCSQSLETVGDLLACFAPHDRTKLRNLLSGAEDVTGVFSRTFQIDTGERECIAVKMRVAFAFDEGLATGWLATVEDVTTERAELDAIKNMAERDPLTGAHNRLYFEKALDAATELAQTKRELAGLILINLDDFKGLVQTHGHLAGDMILRYCARVLTNLVRSTDTVVRLSGDEFAIILSSTSDEDGLTRRAHKIAEALATEVVVGDDVVPVSASIGLAIYPFDTVGGVDLFKAASYALREAGRAGTPSVVRYSQAIRERRDAERSFIEDVRRAIAEGEFEPFFQPKVDLESGAIVGFEALCRWRHPQRGVLTPGAFWMALESPVVGVDLSNVSLAGSFRAAEELSRMGLDFGHISVNLSARQLAQRDLIALVASLQQQHSIPASHIAFEVLENVLIREKGTVRDNLNTLADMGFMVALDDFGTGFASLTHIREPFIREVKIDRSFVTNAGANPSSQKIVAAIVQMARKLRLRMVAEGIEDEETLRKLRAMGCTVGQGFVFSQALPLNEAAEFLGRQSRITALLRGIPNED